MPTLTIIAGCNGAGKSKFASSFLPDTLKSFDYDKVNLEFYNSNLNKFFDSTEDVAQEYANKSFQSAIERALNNQEDFCYETNFVFEPMYWPQKFKDKGFVLNIIFFCLVDIELAKERVAMRAEFKGHNVSEETIKYKWKEGYKNINMHYREFDNILIVDNSRKNEVYSNIIQSLDGQIEQLSESLPEYFERRFPTIFNEIQNIKLDNKHRLDR